MLALESDAANRRRAGLKHLFKVNCKVKIDCKVKINSKVKINCQVNRQATTRPA